MSQMPDSIWLHKDTKYSTTDEVFAYQYKFLIEEDIDNYIEYIPIYRKKESIRQLIEKAWDWIEDNMLTPNQRDKSLVYYEQFKNYMEGE